MTCPKSSTGVHQLPHWSIHGKCTKCGSTAPRLVESAHNPWKDEVRAAPRAGAYGATSEDEARNVARRMGGDL